MGRSQQHGGNAKSLGEKKLARVLLIEDEDYLREALRQALVEKGFDVVEAKNGLQGVTLYRKNPADIVVTDLIMPRYDGTEAIRQIRKVNPGAKIIAVSGRGGDQINANLTRSVMLGADRTLSKPFKLEALLRTIDELLGVSAGDS